MRTEKRHRMGVVAAALLVSCTVGPDYVKPTVEAPETYKEIDGWKIAQPRDGAAREPWWKVFGDPELDALVAQVQVSNQTLAQVAAQYRQSRAAVRLARASYYPTVTGTISVTRNHRFPSTGTFGGISPIGGGQVTPGTGRTSDFWLFSLPVDVSWEPDLWGRIRRTVEASEANAQATAADLANVRLSVQAQLAQDYFQLRSLDSQKRLFDETVAAYERVLQVTKNRYAQGVVSRADVLQAEAQLESARAQAIDIGLQRTQLEHAIAVLVGRPPATFSIPEAPLVGMPPEIPLYVPSEVLERRPDIAAAERRVASANAQIGVAEAAYFPRLTLSASGGFLNTDITKWLILPSRFWSVGPSVSAPIFNAGLAAQTEQVRAAYDATVAAYRQATLTAFQEVEDNLAALKFLEEEAQAQDRAVIAARHSVGLLRNQYKAGTASFSDVLVSQTTALTAERTAAELHGRRMIAGVQLIKALGGGWSTSELPSAEEVRERNLQERKPVSDEAGPSPSKEAP